MHFIYLELYFQYVILIAKFTILYFKDTNQTYTSLTGSIETPRYLGYFGSKISNATPNNFLGIYKIKIEENVTIQLAFRDLTVAGANCEDSLTVRRKFSLITSIYD